MKISVLCLVLLLSACGGGNLPDNNTNSSAQQPDASTEATVSLPTTAANSDSDQIVWTAPPAIGAAFQQIDAETETSSYVPVAKPQQATVESQESNLAQAEQVPTVSLQTVNETSSSSEVVSSQLTVNEENSVLVSNSVDKAPLTVDEQTETGVTEIEKVTDAIVATTEEAPEINEASEDNPDAQECVAYIEPEPTNTNEENVSNEPEIGAALPLVPNSGNTPNGPNYEDLLQSDSRIGFGAKTTGGFGGELCLVTNLSDSGSGSFRDCVEKNEANWIRFDVNGIIQSSGFIYLNSNKTIDGRGADITLSGENGLICFGKTNIIVHNIKFKNIGNGIKLRESCNNVWVDHVDFSNMGDESLAADKGSTNITFSWNRIYKTDKATLIGGTPEQTETRNSRITMHHNLLSADQRNPNVRHAGVHVFNNVIENFLWEGMVSTQGGKVISQNNYLNPNNNMRNRDQSQVANVHNQGDYEIGYFWSDGDSLENGASKSGPGHNPNDVSKFDIPYNFELEEVSETLTSKIREKAGWQQ